MLEQILANLNGDVGLGLMLIIIAAILRPVAMKWLETSRENNRMRAENEREANKARAENDREKNRVDQEQTRVLEALGSQLKTNNLVSNSILRLIEAMELRLTETERTMTQRANRRDGVMIAQGEQLDAIQGNIAALPVAVVEATEPQLESVRTSVEHSLTSFETNIKRHIDYLVSLIPETARQAVKSEIQVALEQMKAPLGKLADLVEAIDRLRLAGQDSREPGAEAPAQKGDEQSVAVDS